MRLVKKILVITLLSILGLFLIGTVLVYIFEDDIKRYAVERLNKNLNTQVQVDNIELSLLSNFPNATLEFKNVFIPDAYENRTSTDTFLVAAYIGMEFDLLDMYRGNYEVKKIKMRDGMVNIKVDEDGDENYNIWKSSDDEEDSDEEFKFKLENMSMSNVELNYRNYHSGQDYSFYANKLGLSGDFYESAFDLKIKSDMRINEFKSKAIRIVRDRNAFLDLVLAVDTEADSYTISTGHLDIEKLKFDVTGQVVDDSVNTYCDLAINGKDIDLADFFSSFAGDALSDFEEYKSEGQLAFNSTVKGNIGPVENPMVNASFDVAQGDVVQTSTGIRIGDLHLKGTYTSEGRSGKEELVLNGLRGTFLEKPFSGDFKLTDFGTPRVDVSAKGTLDLNAIRSFFNLTDIEKITGIAQFDTDLDFTIVSPQNPELRNVEVHRSRGKVDFSGLTLKLAAYPYLYENVKGAFYLRGEDAAVKGLSMKVGSSEIQIDGAFQNFLSHLLRGQKKLNIVADLESPRLNLDDFILASEPSPSTEGQSNEPFEFPSTINFNLDTEIGELKYGSFSASRIRGNIVLLDKVLTGKNLYMKTCGGRISGGFEMDGTESGLFVSTFNGSIRGMNVDQAMVNFDRFGQTMFTENNLKGEIDATFDVAALLNGDLDFDMNSITAEANVIIDDGEIIELEAFKDITDYMRENKSMDILFSRHIDELEKRLRRVKFSRMKNKIYVKNSIVTIPDMVIKSNVMDVGLSGTHTFNDEIDYSMNFRFRDLLSKEDEYSEFGRIVDDGTGLRIFLRMTGTVDDPIITIDKEQKRATLKEDLKEEGETMKSILKKEFGLYKNDTTVKEYEETPKEEVEFLITTEDEEEKTFEQEEREWEERRDSIKQAKRNKTKIGKFIKKLKEEKEEEKGDVKFEVEK